MLICHLSPSQRYKHDSQFNIARDTSRKSPFCLNECETFCQALKLLPLLVCSLLKGEIVFGSLNQSLVQGKKRMTQGSQETFLPTLLWSYCLMKSKGCSSTKQFSKPHMMLKDRSISKPSYSGFLPKLTFILCLFSFSSRCSGNQLLSSFSPTIPSPMTTYPL